MLACKIDVFQNLVHDKFPTVTDLVKQIVVIGIDRFIIPRKISVSLHFVKIEIGSPESGNSTIVVEGCRIGGRSRLVDILQKIIAAEEIGPCTIGPSRHLIYIKICHQQRTGSTGSQIVAGSATATGQFLCTWNEIYIKTIGIKVQFSLVGKELVGIQFIGRLLVKEVAARSKCYCCNGKTVYYLFHHYFVVII